MTLNYFGLSFLNQYGCKTGVKHVMCHVFQRPLHSKEGSVESFPALGNDKSVLNIKTQNLSHLIRPRVYT